MTQLRALTALTGDLSFVPSTYTAAQNQFSNVFFQVPEKHMVHRYTCRQDTDRHEIKKLSIYGIYR